MSHESQISLKGQFLIAMPGLKDPNFARTVVCMCEHTPDGCVGVVINRQFPSLTAKDIFQELHIEARPEIGTAPVHYGGPVHEQEIFILHGPPFEWDGCLKVTPFVGMSNTRDVLEAIAAGAGPEDFLISLGCAGWGPQQMESEMMQNVWLSTPASKEILFDSPLDGRWEAAVKELGIEPALLSGAAGNA
ncbi:MAG: YqgE/AlgH family protein [Thermodesulfobacteriota bacterium]